MSRSDCCPLEPIIDCRERTKLSLRKKKVNEAIFELRRSKMASETEEMILEIKIEELNLKPSIIESSQYENLRDYLNFISSLLKSDDFDEMRYGILQFRMLTLSPSLKISDYINSELMLNLILLFEQYKDNQSIAVSRQAF